MPNPNTAKNQDNYAVPNTHQSVEVEVDQLPLHCPTPETALWCSHPRVYLPIEESKDGKILCPYCGTLYVMKR